MRGLLLQCTIKKDKGGKTYLKLNISLGFGNWNPKYHVYMSNGMHYMLSAKKMAYNKSANYLISLE